jgi:H+/Cl- antiporter ClcA
MISDELLFLLFNAKIAFFSDILLNILATRNIGFLEKYSFMNSLKTLKPYFVNKSMFQAAFYALLTVVIIVGIIMKLFQIFYDKYLPETNKEIFIYLVLSFIVGYIGDILIYKWDIFPKLQKYYRVVGKGLWGAIAIVFSVFMSLIYLYIFNNYNKLYDKFTNIIY